jgi:hypothetical protein
MSPTPKHSTELDFFEFKKAHSSSARKQTLKPDGSVRQRAGSLRYLSNKDKVNVRCTLEKACVSGTATWQWDGVRNKHVIMVSPSLPAAFFDDRLNNPTRRVALTKSVIAHEVCHGLYTSKSSDVHRMCADLKIPFRLVNLMEDARIEYRYVKERGKEFKFGWRMFDDKMRKASDKINSPMDWLFTMKTREPILFKTLGSVMAPFHWGGAEYTEAPAVAYPHALKRWEGRRMATRSLFNLFYEGIVEAATTEDVVSIARYWQHVFGKEPESSLSPIIIKTVPQSIDGVTDPSAASSATEAVRAIDHSAATEIKAGDPSSVKRGSISEEKVMYHNTDEFIRQPPRAGFASLKDYLNRNY